MRSAASQHWGMLPSELAPLGTGSFGRVYRAFEARYGDVAVKVLLDPDTERERFVREAHLLVEQAGNDHIVRILRWDLTGPTPYLILEFCGGPRLRSWVGRVDWQ